MLKTDSLREAMTRSCRWCQATRKNSPFSWRAATLKRPEKPLVCYRYQMVMFVMDYAGELDDLTLPLLAWLSKNQPQLLLNLSVIRTSNSPPLSMTMTAPISCLRSPCGNAFALRATVRAHRRQNTCRSQNPACPLPKATGRMYSRM
ncbi:Phage tail completion protein R [Escherichia coli]|nr:Phage tail completion protein R [Escherichia coli]